jgi:hypothetical protein
MGTLLARPFDSFDWMCAFPTTQKLQVSFFIVVDE